MSSNITYHIEFCKDEDEQQTKQYLAFLRQVLLEADRSIVPKKITYEKDYSDIIEPSYFARRLSLLTHQKTEEVDLNSHVETFVLRNDTNQKKSMYASELIPQAKSVRPLEPDYLLLFLEPQQQIRFSLEYQEGTALQDAKFSTMEKISFNFERPPYSLKLKSFKELEPIVEVMKTNLTQDIKNLYVD